MSGQHDPSECSACMTVEHITAMLHTWLPGLTMKMMIMMMMLNNFFYVFFFFICTAVQKSRRRGSRGRECHNVQRGNEAQLLLFFLNIYLVLILKFQKRRQDYKERRNRRVERVRGGGRGRERRFMTKRWKRGSERIARKAKVTHSKPKKRSATSWELYEEKKKTRLNHRRLGVFSLAHGPVCCVPP